MTATILFVSLCLLFMAGIPSLIIIFAAEEQWMVGRECQVD